MMPAPEVKKTKAKNNDRSVAKFLNRQSADRRLHPKSLVSTYFGDIVMPNDGFTWVETMFSAFEPLGINDRLVRTTLYRMREEGWVEATRAGRKSYYELSAEAKRQTYLAERLIYHSDLSEWDGAWTLIFLVVGNIDVEVKREFLQELNWIGFGAVTKGVWAHPSANTELVGELVNELGLEGKVICMRCENIQDAQLGLPIDDRQLARLCMPLGDVAAKYEEFVAVYSGLLNLNGEFKHKGSHAEMLSLRLLMVDDFRRVILHDPHLPSDLLPENWAGHTAYQLIGSIYRQLYEATSLEYKRLQENAGVPAESIAGGSREPLYSQRFQVK